MPPKRQMLARHTRVRVEIPKKEKPKEDTPKKRTSQNDRKVTPQWAVQAKTTTPSMVSKAKSSRKRPTLDYDDNNDPLISPPSKMKVTRGVRRVPSLLQPEEALRLVAKSPFYKKKKVASPLPSPRPTPLASLLVHAKANSCCPPLLTPKGQIMRTTPAKHSPESIADAQAPHDKTRRRISQ
uniref:Uncharacterized protein n=1 Tax=Eutreptiella gymnastica TaxID=73025 RepID=A0A7S1NMK3_9EUGL|mmetsp:Transcript_59162/g.105591  ORF Transcript_59162/g.105591 Transcript_59162/m.105591 type:complete len:182 (+) Transcript_59162:65-610(+)